MANPVWGELSKSQDDDETIEEAIARLIASHNEDSESHLGENQSLQSHKAAEIIDHLALSIVSDKIKDKEVTFRKTFEDRFVFRSSFASLDSFFKVGFSGSSDYDVSGGMLKIYHDDSQDSVCSIGAESPISILSANKSPLFGVYWFPDTEDGSHEAAIMCGKFPAVDNPKYAFGFSWHGSPLKLYAYVRGSGSSWTEEITGVSMDEFRHYYAEMKEDGSKVVFLIDGEQVAEYDDTAISIGEEIIFCVSTKQIGTYGGGNSYLSQLLFSQDW